MLKTVDKSLKKNNFSTRTEFIRTAIRDKLDKMKREDLIKELMKLRGSAKKKVSDRQLRIAREKALKELIKEKGWDFK